jgi:DNA-directed RNA polymerase subunit RPC12/RpoP
MNAKRYAPKCLNCGKRLDGHTGVSDRAATPKNGDVSICLYCGEPMIYTGKAFRLPTREEFGAMMTDENFARALAVVATRKTKDAVAVVIDPETGTRTVLATTPDAICEMCGKLDELRPYGPRKADGKRMVICFPCAHKDEAELQRAFLDRIEGRNPS